MSADQNPHRQNEELYKNLPEVDQRTLKRAGKILLGTLAALFLVGWVPREIISWRTRRESRALQNAVAQVQTVKPKQAQSGGDLSLPGNSRAFQNTAIFPRATGYLIRLHADIGSKVAAGDVLAEIDSPDLDAQLTQAQADLTKAEADAALAAGTLKRYEGFAKSGGVTQQQLDERRSASNQTASTLASAKANVQRLTDLQQYEKITAPFPGVITARNYDIGALLAANTSTPGKELFQIARTDTLRVFVNVPQSYVTDVADGQPARFLVSNYPGKEFTGEVARTAGALDEATRTLNTEIDIPNPNGELFAGMYGEVKLTLNHKQPLIIPSSAVIFDSNGTKVATVVDNKIHFKPIVLGRDFGAEIEASSGLDGTEDLVSNPGLRMAEGVPVQMSQPQPAEQKGK